MDLHNFLNLHIAAHLHCPSEHLGLAENDGPVQEPMGAPHCPTGNIGHATLGNDTMMGTDREQDARYSDILRHGETSPTTLLIRR